MFRIKTDTREFVIKDSMSEEYFDDCMGVLLGKFQTRGKKPCVDVVVEELAQGLEATTERAAEECYQQPKEEKDTYEEVSSGGGYNH